MIDRLEQAARMTGVEPEDRAMLRSNPSAGSMPGQGQAFGTDTERLSPLHLFWPQCDKPTVAWNRAFRVCRPTRCDICQDRMGRTKRPN
jgi:hypothetical protein